MARALKRTVKDSTPTKGQINKWNRVLRKYAVQIAATFIVSLLHIPLIGVNLAYSAVLIAQLEECQAGERFCSNIIGITDTHSAWIASLLTIFIPVGGVIGGFMLDSLGRLAVLRLAAFPSVAGWVLIATATNVPMLLIGRVLNGIATSWAVSATFVYISEVSKPHIRGSMVTIPSTLGALGILLTYTMGYYLDWHIIAWITLIFIALATSLTVVLPQSPVWLVSKGRVEMARIALESLNKYHETPEKEAKEQLEALVKIYSPDEKEPQITCIDKLKMFLEPTVYKPLLILTFFNYFVQFSGLSVIIFYAVTLFQDAGTNINPYVASIGIGGARFIASIATIGLMQRFGRRQLMIASGLAMAVSIGVSGIYTKWILEGTTTHLWVPLAMMALYVIATMIGFLGIPIAIPAELFPTKVRGMGQSLAMGILYAMAFASTRSYYDLSYVLGGSSGLQMFFAATSLAGAIYTYIFLPETHKKGLHEIEEYFKNNSVYLLYKIRANRKQKSKEKEADCVV